MYIVQSISDNITELQHKYLLLELDTFKINDVISTAYCVLDNKEINLQVLGKIDEKKEQHNQALECYKTKQWDDCLIMVGELHGTLSTSMDSFYENLIERVELLKCDIQDNEWSPIINKNINI